MKNAEEFRSGPFAWGKVPLLLPLVALAIGIFLADFLGYPSSYLLPIILSASLIWALLYGWLRRRYIMAWKPDLWLLLFILLLAGVWRAGTAHPPNAANYVGAVATENGMIGGQIARLRPGEKTIRAELDVQFIRKGATDQPATGRILVYLPPDIKTGAVRVGDRIVVQGRPEPLRGPLNPGAFDARSYWATQGVYHSLYIKDASRWRHIRVEGFSPVARAEILRRAWFKSFQRYLVGDRLAVAAALVLGKKDLLTSEVRSAYAETGATHVLAVSGLHVGIIYWLIGMVFWALFRFTPYREAWWARALETGLTILLVWVFAFVTGLSPSVQRAGTMFTVIALGKLGLGRTYIINSLCVAALGMLWWDPKLLFQLGFLLSFMALIGIVWFTTPFQRLLPIGNRWLGKVWSGVAASVGAQLGTLPVALYVFGQFSWLFWLSGSAVVFFAFLVMTAGVVHGLLVAIFGYGAVSAVTGWVLGQVVYLQNAFVYFFNEHALFSWAVQEVRSFPLASALLLTGAIVALAGWVQWRKVEYGLAALGLATGSVVFALSQVPGLGQGEAVVTVYHLPYHSLVDVYTSGQSYAIGDSVDARSLTFNVLPNRKQLGYGVGERRAIDNLTQFRTGSSWWAVLDGERSMNTAGIPENVDYLLIRNGFPKRFADLDLPVTATVVVDGSNPPWRYEKWEAAAERQGFELWITGERGALVVRGER